MSRPLKDLTGLRFGKLVVLGKSVDRHPMGYIKWTCLCDCGKETRVISRCLREGNTKSCGCFRRDRTKNLNLSHGLHKDIRYRIWNSARSRAERKDLEFNLNIDDIEIPEFCPLLGIPLIPRSHSRNSPVLDRLDNSRGYTRDNVWVVSCKANLIKSNLTLEQMKNVVKAWEERVTSNGVL